MIAYKIILSEEFTEKFENIFSYIETEAQNPANAQKVKQRIFATIKNFSEFPNLGHTGKEENTLEFTVKNTPCTIVYTVNDKNQTVNIVTIWHTSQNR